MKVNLSDKIAFNGRRENWQNYENFRDFFEQKDSVTLLRESLSPDFKAGEGFSSRVYSICGNDTFMLKVDKFEAAPLKKISLKQEKDYFPELNLGQKIASLNEFASVIIRQNGLPCGIKHFENKKYQQVTKADLPDFIDYLRKVSEILVIHKNRLILCLINCNVLVGLKFTFFDILNNTQFNIQYYELEEFSEKHCLQLQTFRQKP